MRRRASSPPLPAAAAGLLLPLLLLNLSVAFDEDARTLLSEAPGPPDSRLEPIGEARNGGDGTPPPLSRHLPSLRASARFTACSSSASTPFHLTYDRPTVTPIVFIRDGGPTSQPCAVLKLSCRVRTSVPSVRAGREGMGRYPEPWTDMVWSEVAAQALLESLSPAHFSGRGSGALLAHAGDDFLRGVPDECIWRGEGDPLVGAALRFVPDLHTVRITPAVMRRWVAHPETLRAVAATWVVDALLLNHDRRSNCAWDNNVFVGRGERLVALDFGEWDARCDADGEVRRLAQLPTLSHCLLEGGEQLCASRDWRRALEAAAEMAAEACGADAGGKSAACPRLAERMRASLERDPYFQLASQRPTLFRSSCPYGDERNYTYRACVGADAPADDEGGGGAAPAPFPADDVRYILQRRIDDSCVQRHGNTATAFLSSLTASRLAIFLEAAREQLAAC
jgi:hypothetical protein